MIQKSTQCFESQCGKAKIYVENDMPVGILHDFLLNIKGHLVDIMVKTQKDEEKITEDQKKLTECPGKYLESAN